MLINGIAILPSGMKGQTFYPEFLRAYPYFTMILPYITLACTAIYVILKKPGFFELQIEDGNLYLKTSPFQEKSLEIKSQGYLGHEFDSSNFGFAKNLMFYKQTKAGVMATPKYSVSLLSKKQRSLLEQVLRNHQKQYGKPLNFKR